MVNFNKDKTVLLTGGAGFIGSHIAETLLQLEKKGNHTNQNLYKAFSVKKIRILDNLVTGKRSNIEKLSEDSRIEFQYGDINNLEACRKAMKGVDVVCHQAALGSVPRSINDPLSSHESNANGFLNILLAAKENGIKRVVYASSSSVYGDSETLPKVESGVGEVISPYAATKKICEIYANVFTRCYGMECIGLRYFNIFGPRQDPSGPYAAVIPKFIASMQAGISPTMNGDGTNSRDFTHVSNAVHANILAMTTQNAECFGKAFNIASGGRVSLTALFQILKEKLGYDGEPLYGPKREGDIPHSFADISAGKKYLGYDVITTFEAGVTSLIPIQTL